MNLDTITTAVYEHLAAVMPVGRGVQPSDTGWQGAPGHSVYVGYAILWRLGSLDARSATVEDLFEIHRPSFFIRVFSDTPSGADQLIGTMRDQMLRVPLLVPGLVTHRVWLDNSQTTTRSDTVEIGNFEAGDFFRMNLSPA